ncbi:MAG TPA: response regulator transcription factor [Longimicrobium sp.]|nr:response regulator transcription factor [Longimicrobium sp.]
MKRVLVVEDNQDLALGLQMNLEVQGYAVQAVHEGTAVLEAARAFRPDLVVLDLMLPGIDGFQVLADLRAAGVDAAVLILSARGEEVDKVRGFRLGADDYVVKPFGLMELLARVEALLRRGAASPAGQRAEPPGEAFGDVVVEVESRRVVVGGVPVNVTPKAFDLLVALLQRNGRVASRLDLLREVWGHRSAVESRTVDTHIAELRRKIEADPAHPRHILTVWKAGYRLQR